MIVVTLIYNNMMFDLQMPTDIPVGDMLVWILEYVNKIMRENMQPDKVALVLDRKEEVIRTDLTLDEFGVRNGDYISVLKMG